MFFCVLSVRRRRQESGVIYVTVADLSIAGLGVSETGDSFDTSQAEHFVTAKGLAEISDSPALFTTGQLSDY